MKKAYVLLAALGLLGLLGCGDGSKAVADKTAQQMRQSFDNAPEELKTKYQAVKTAVESGDIMKAKAALDELQPLQSRLSPDQQGAVLELKQALMLKAATAAQNGDKNAAAVIQDLRSQSRSR